MESVGENMKKYIVGVPLVGYYYTEVEAENEYEAEDKAIEQDFELCDIEELYGVKEVCKGNV